MDKVDEKKKAGGDVAGIVDFVEMKLHFDGVPACGEKMIRLGGVEYRFRLDRATRVPAAVAKKIQDKNIIEVRDGKH